MKSAKQTQKANSKKREEEKNQEAAAATTGRVHTIAKARPTPVTRAPKDKPAAVIAGDDEPATPLARPTAAAVQPPKKVKGSAANAITEHKVDEIVVFAFRMLRSERDELHAATGSAKASRFVKAIVLAGARGDMKAVTELMEEAQAGRK